MKKILLSILSFAIIFSGGIAVANYTITEQYENKNELSFRREIVFAIDALEEYVQVQDEETLRVIISHVYAARELSQDDMWNALHEVWNALLFDDETLLSHIYSLVLALNEGDASAIEQIAMNMRI